MRLDDSSGDLWILGNFTTLNYGFFSYLGSLTSRVTGLFVQNIDFNGTINGTGNIITTGNLTVGGDANVTGTIITSAINFTGDLNHGIRDNSTCIIIEGDTSTLNIC